jgi:hypothetical protein
MVSDTALSKRDLLLLICLFLLEATSVFILKALDVKGERPFDVFISTKPGLAFLCAAIVFLIAGAGIINLYLVNRHSPSRYFRLIVAMNLVTVLLILVTGEIVVRAGSRIHLDGEAFGKVALVPKNWETTRTHYRNVLEKADGDLTYLVYDDRMGWSVGSNRRSANGLYRSSPTGIRVPQEGVAFTMAEGKATVALVGDSFTFGEEVRYEESWGYHLDQLLGEEVQVLNFGVPGFGVDQAYLRYEKDASRWKPKVAIFGLFSNDFLRTMTVYPFIANPRWEMPFSKPRFRVSDGKSEILNVPPLRPEVIFSHESIFELPFLTLDRGYKESNWQTSVYHSSYLFQLFVSVLPRWSAVTPDFSEEAFVSINASILKSFVQTAAQEGTIPVAVYFPGRMELRRSSEPPTVVKRILHDIGMGYVNPSPCLLKVNPADRFMPGGHYTPAGNAAVAKCLGPVIQEALRQAAVGKETGMAEPLTLSR